MEVFAHFDLFSAKNGVKVAEGHKASFCLEDNACEDQSSAKYKCAGVGDQGISVGCRDIYLNSIDCQWIDVSDLEAGNYTLKVAVNPDKKVKKSSFDNNAVLCHIAYDFMSVVVLGDCLLTSI